jgi:hypothetical protein
MKAARITTGKGAQKRKFTPATRAKAFSVFPNIPREHFIFAAEAGISPAQAVDRAIEKRNYHGVDYVAVVPAQYGGSPHWQAEVEGNSNMEYTFVPGRMKLEGQKHSSPNSTLLIRASWGAF